MKNFSYIIPNFRIVYFLLVILLTSFLIVPKTYASDHHEDIDLFKLFLRVFTEAEKKYVDEIDKDQLMDSALKGMLNSLDPYSTYLSEKDFEEMDIDTKGFYGGLGLEVTLDDNGFVRIVSPIDDTPGSRAGLISGDYITGINGEDVYGMSLDEAVDRMRGYANTSIILTIYRDGDDAPFDVEIVREIIQITPVKFELLEDNIGYIRISSFNDIADKKIVSAVKEINRKSDNNIKGFIIDIRNNPGGLLDQAIKVTDLFLDKGEIVSTKTRDQSRKQRFFAKKGDITNGAEIIIITNGGSASASEIFAGALGDNKRATIIGTKTYGKGSVQSIIPLGSGDGAIRLTTGKYYTPNDTSIDKVGIMPIYIIENQITEVDSEDLQLIYAKKLINSRYRLRTLED
jgi:carboxyl-terminal processing protease|tara:strand:+ start:281 stop:1483 length:1203 start_codon:yes stop_codon:yes gene_type:complete